MNQEKFNICLERMVLRCNKNKKISSTKYPKAFGNKEKNNFIRSENEEYILKLKSPTSSSISEAYYKLQEITNVVYSELYSLNEIVWPFSSFNNINLNSKITLSINKENYEELKKVNKVLPEKLEDAFKNLKNEFKNKSYILEKLYGKCTLKVSKSNIELSELKNNYRTRMGMTYDDICFLVTFIFSLLEKNEFKSFKEEFKILENISKKYSLKTKESLENVLKEIQNQKSRLEQEAELTDKEKTDLIDKYMEEGYETRYALLKYKKLEKAAVVLIKDAIYQGIDYKVLNESKSIVEFELNGHKEFVIEGNKTDRDTYIFPIITDDKLISKQIMADYGLNVPKAILLDSEMDREDIEELASKFFNKTAVIKPRNTNYGTGISVFDRKASKEEILTAIDYAFKFDNNVLIEEFAKGMEYRFLVIDGKCLSVAHRRAASVVGDGKSTIKELMIKKSNEYWHRLVGSPLKMDLPLEEHLKSQGYNYDTVIPEGKRVFLRTNSNCSSGGEAVDVTDEMPVKFKKIAEKAAKAFDAKICGVDIIVEDFKKDNYSIVEINDNPGYSISEWPYEGKEQKIGLGIFKLLGLVQE